MMLKQFCDMCGKRMHKVNFLKITKNYSFKDNTRNNDVRMEICNKCLSNLNKYINKEKEKI